MVYMLTANIWGILMVNVTIYSIHGSYGIYISIEYTNCLSSSFSEMKDAWKTPFFIGMEHDPFHRLGTGYWAISNHL